ncbi:Fic/DOC family N-terminal domain-containing protein [Chryseolinea sp. T2]|uniref:Fic family protein n=1 Tax=Chryseolinea sp. T2 TaxID=3129255 RepID=UPI003076AFF0
MPYALNPDRNTPWNGLPSLPLDAAHYRTIEILEQLGKAKGALGQLQGRSIAVPNQGLLVNTISLQEAKASSAIENILTTDDELYKAYSEVHNEQLDGAAKEVLRYREALWAGHTYLKSHPSFDRDYFISIYRQIKQTNDSVRPPAARITIRQGGSGPNAGQPVYTPPRGEGIIEQKLDNLIAFLNADGGPDPLIKMAIAHLQFEAIHPFRDGNGRTGRILNINFLTQQGQLDYPILFLSRHIIDTKDEYYHHLAGVTQRGDWQSWILYMLQAIEITSRVTYSKINEIVDAIDGVREALGKTTITKQEQLITMLFMQPFTRVKHLTEGRLYAENTARKNLNQLVSMGILELRVLQGNHYYQNLELQRILSE